MGILTERRLKLVTQEIEKILNNVPCNQSCFRSLLQYGWIIREHLSKQVWKEGEGKGPDLEGELEGFRKSSWFISQNPLHFFLIGVWFTVGLKARRRTSSKRKSNVIASLGEGMRLLSTTYTRQCLNTVLRGNPLSQLLTPVQKCRIRSPVVGRRKTLSDILSDNSFPELLRRGGKEECLRVVK